ncbi:MAG: mismatch-specific glycosylase [Herbinix sp.]|jgi:hypoxanthine-DNA glycosylase|nr:mismatch-specific glycosylase [Herbinix sp.]
MERFTHPVEPVYNSSSKVLILGTFPSVKSREGRFFYHHPQNRFWKVIGALCGDEMPHTIEEKKEMLLMNRIAVWDVIHSCEVTGSSDSSIRNVIVNDISVILDTAEIGLIAANGAVAERLYNKYIYPQTGREIYKLPSTSPANATYTLEKLVLEWSYLLNFNNEDTKG